MRKGLVLQLCVGFAVGLDLQYVEENEGIGQSVQGTSLLQSAAVVGHASLSRASAMEELATESVTAPAPVASSMIWQDDETTAPEVVSSLGSEKEVEPDSESEAAPEAEAEAEQAAGARFLIQATFGPTHRDLESLHGKSYVQWIQEQMALPVASHRAHYRKRVNPQPRGTSQEQEALGSFRSPCDVGARWVDHVFVKRDSGKRVRVEAGKIYVDDVFRSDVQMDSTLLEWDGWIRGVPLPHL